MPSRSQSRERSSAAADDGAEKPWLRVGLIGSSGGGAATLGHASPHALLGALDTQLRACRASVVAVQLVCCEFAPGRMQAWG